jgi:hypothetical protein
VITGFGSSNCGCGAFAMTGDAEALFRGIVFHHHIADVEDHLLSLTRFEFDMQFKQFGLNGIARILASRPERSHLKLMRAFSQGLQFFGWGECQAWAVVGLGKSKLQRQAHALVEGHPFGFRVPPSDQ